MNPHNAMHHPTLESLADDLAQGRITSVQLTEAALARIAATAADDATYFHLNGLILRNTAPINFWDGCALSIPCHEPGSAPVGLMIAGPALSDARILAWGLAIESALAQR